MDEEKNGTADTPAEATLTPTPPPPPSSPSAEQTHRRGNGVEAIGRVLLVPLALVGILLLGAAFRLTDLHWVGATATSPGHFVFVPWDEGLNLHPDERFLTWVAMDMRFPLPCQGLIRRLFVPEGAAPRPTPNLGACFGAYLDTATSTLNPRNVGHGLWVYGSLPMILFRGLVESLNITAWAEVTEAGRVVSALADLATVLLTFFLAKRLLGSRAGLLAALFLALSVLNIQNAHFFTVDIVTALLTLACVYLAVVVAEGKGSWGTFLLLGLFFGLAVASKVNVATFALVIALAGAIRVWRKVKEQGEEALWPAVLRTALGLFLAAVLSVVVFRLAQPDAFTGPGFFDVKLESRYLGNLETVQGLVSGEMDYYPSHQWTERTALVFPWTNMVAWGLGLPLGLAAWAGVVWAGWRLVRRRDLRLVVPLSWTLLLFLYQGVQFVKTMRYFLPIYPLLCIFAAYLLLSLWDWARSRENGRVGAGHASPRQGDVHENGAFPWRTVLAGTLLAVVAVGTLLWAWGFIQLYRRPVTRITASRWVFKNLVPDRGAWLTLSDGTTVPIAVPNAQTYAAGMTTETPFSLPTAGTATGVTLAHLEDRSGSPGQEWLQVSLCADRGCGEPLAQGDVRGDFSGVAGDSAPGVATLPPTALEAGRTYYLRVVGLQGNVCLWGVALANEQWDDAVPYSLDGKAAFGIERSCTGTYRGLTLSPYGEDTPEKVEDLLHQLANTDYVLLTSNRLYDSIPRLPMRYPATTRYYRFLFDGSLGFERVATFTSYPTLFAFGVPSSTAVLSDEQRAAEGLDWGGIALPDQGAEEAFSVYDHPVVQIFRRTAAFDVDRARALLTDGIEWDKVARIRPVEVPAYWAKLDPQQRDWVRQGNTPTSGGAQDLLLTPTELQEQRRGGTWSDIFPPSGWPTKVALPLWLLLVEVLGLAAWPLANVLLGRLRDGGYLPAKALGLLLLGYLSWLLAATKLLPYTRWTIALVLAVLVIAGGAVGWFRRKELLEVLRARRKLLLLEEGIFLAGFLLFLLIRFGNPDVWHPWYGGEKPMDLAYLTAVIRSTTLPPYDPWFAGGYLNYYYFGQVLIATLVKLTGIVPAVAYNLALPTLYGLVCGGAFTVVYHLVMGRRESADGWYRPAIVSALVGVAFIAVLGNLGQFVMLVRKLGDASQLDFQSNIPGLAGLVRAVAGIPNALRNGLGLSSGALYWDASRTITTVMQRAPNGNEINEFPFFTFLYADLHAHMIALPFTLLILTQVVALVQESKPGDRSWLALLPPPWTLLTVALVLGTLRAANFWDFPTYLLVVLAGWAVALYERRRRIDWQLVAGLGVLAALLWFLSTWLLAPFWARFGLQYNSVVPWTGERTRVAEYVITNGLALFILVTYLLVQSFGTAAREGPLHLVGLTLRFWDRLPALVRRLRRFGKSMRQRPAPHSSRGGWALPVLLWSLAVLLVVALFFFLPAGQPAEGVPAPQQSFFLHLRDQPVVGWMLIFLVLGAVLFFRRRTSAEERLLAMLVIAGLGISAGVELVVVKGDISRQNTSFKFYMQVWVLWGVAAAAMLPRLWERTRSWSRGARGVWRTALCILVGLCALYPLLAAPAKVRDRWPGNALGPGLDGEAFMSAVVYGDPQGNTIALGEDAPAFRWLEENVVGTPVILEAQTPEYRWGSRFSIYTGMPTLIGWNWHQTQQRGGDPVQKHVQDLNTLYNGTDIPATVALLGKYQVSYIVVGQLERDYYDSAGLAKFEQMVGTYLERVYPVGGAAIAPSPGAGAARTAVPATATAGPGAYPQPQAPAYAGPTSPPAGPGSEAGRQAPVYPEPTPPATSSISTQAGETVGTVIYRVLPSVWQP